MGSADGVGFLVMEFLEGETLMQRLGRGPLVLGPALQIAIQIAEALDPRIARVSCTVTSSPRMSSSSVRRVLRRRHS